MFIGDACARTFVVSGSLIFVHVTKHSLNLLTKHAYALVHMPVYHCSIDMIPFDITIKAIYIVIFPQASQYSSV